MRKGSRLVALKLVRGQPLPCRAWGLGGSCRCPEVLGAQPGPSQTAQGLQPSPFGGPHLPHTEEMQIPAGRSWGRRSGRERTGSARLCGRAQSGTEKGNPLSPRSRFLCLILKSLGTSRNVSESLETTGYAAHTPTGTHRPRWRGQARAFRGLVTAPAAACLPNPRWLRAVRPPGRCVGRRCCPADLAHPLVPS